MPKALVVGNGSVLICLDQHGQVKDFYYDYVGLENHMTHPAVNKVGVWVDSSFVWLDDPSWEVSIDYMEETLSGVITAENKNKQLKLIFNDVVYNEKNIFVRKVTVQNQANRKREIRIFFNHQFGMYGIPKGDTAYFDPEDKTIVHYKGRRIAVIGGILDGESFGDYSVGLLRIEGKEGSWKDAEDGVLSKNPIEHGSVDSTIAFIKTPDAGEEYSFAQWVCFGKTINEVKDLHKYILERRPEHIIETTQDFWHAWVNKLNFSFFGLDAAVTRLFKKSLLIMRTHFDNTGAVIASGDSDMLQYGRDTYGYVWPRDASFVAMALDQAGYFEVAEKFFEFCNETISEEGYFFHKYRCDKSMGSSWHPWVDDKGNKKLPIQEDETALPIYALWQHYELAKDLEFIERNYNSLIKKAADFLLTYKDQSTHLPKPSFDIWEMKYGISTFTASAVYGALVASSKFAKLLGKEDDEVRFASGANEVKEAIANYLYNSEENYFYKLVDLKEDKILHDKTIDASSFYGPVLFEVFNIDDERIERSFKTLEEKLVNKNQVGGVIRFEGDIYHQETSNLSNPWFVTTLWLAQYFIFKAKKPEEMEKVKEILNWVVKYATPSGMLSEQISALDGRQLSASPLSWSHAQFVITLVGYLNKLEDFGVCVACNPVK